MVSHGYAGSPLYGLGMGKVASWEVKLKSQQEAIYCLYTFVLPNFPNKSSIPVETQYSPFVS